MPGMGAAASWEGEPKPTQALFASQVQVPARGRGAVFTSHLPTKACAYPDVATSSFQKDPIKAGGVLSLGLSIAPASQLRNQQQGHGHS